MTPSIASFGVTEVEGGVMSMQCILWWQSLFHDVDFDLSTNVSRAL